MIQSSESIDSVDDNVMKMEGVTSSKGAILFILPSILTVLMTSIYGVADACIVGYTHGANALASVVSILPIQYLLVAIGMMFASGSATHIGHYIGRRDYGHASSHISTILLFVTAVSLFIMFMFASIIGALTHFIGIEGDVFSGAMDYGMAYSWAIPFCLLQPITSQILIITGRGKTAAMTLTAGLVLNVVCDFYLTRFVGMGLSGTAYSTAIGTAFSTIVCLSFLYFDRKSVLRPSLPSKNLSMMVPVCKNGIPQMINTLSLALSTTLLLMFSTKLTGSETIAARSVSINMQALLYSLYIGYNQGSISLTSYFFGKRDKERISMMFRTNMAYTLVLGLFVFVGLQYLDVPISSLFMESEYAKERVRAYMFSLSYTFIVAGTNMAIASMFVATADSRRANMISLTKSLYVGVPMLCTLSLIFGADGLGIAGICTELITLALSLILLVRYGYDYGFLRREPFIGHWR